MRLLVAALAGMLLLAGTAAAQPAPGGTFTVGPTVGTLGLGIEGGFRAGSHLGLRLDASGLPFDYSATISDIPYKFRVKLLSGGPILDFYPFGGGFRLSAGARIDGNSADVTATPAAAVTINGTTFTPAELGTLTGTVKYNPVAPYLGLGYAGAVAPWLVLGVDLGVLYQGRPRVSLAASGSFAGNPALETALAQQQAAIRHKLDPTAWYPALTLSALFRF